LLLIVLLLPATVLASPSLIEVISSVQPKMVKIHGAGGFQGMEDYQSGIVIAADGHLLTAFSHVLDTDVITAVLADGRKFEAKLLGADPRLEVAVLKIESAGLPFFDLSQSLRAEAGTRVFALSNSFNVAVGNEPASVQRGTVSVVTQLAARRGAFETSYRGPVYVLDMTTNNSGAAGGALITRHGDLVGILGKELRNALNGTWLNYAIPIGELRSSVEAILAGKFVAGREDPTRPRPRRSLEPRALGIELIPDVLERTPPYIDQVRDASPAALAGVRPDDLIVLLGDRLVQSCKDLAAELEYIDFEDAVSLTLLRKQELIEVSLRPTDPESPLKKGEP
jgi:serine protease Do